MVNHKPEFVTNEHDACGVGFLYRPQSTHSTISDALQALAQLEHRGATSADGVSGDGAGILTTIPRKIFSGEGVSIGEREAVAVLFTPDRLGYGGKNGVVGLHRKQIEEFLCARGFKAKHWRVVPVSRNSLGPVALSVCPLIEQLVITPSSHVSEADLDSAYSNLRIALSQFMRFQIGEPDFYVSSLSRKSIVYKAMTTSEGLAQFYHDLLDESFEARWAVFHRRFSTNTVSKWPLAQPFRLLAHNGEINTLKGNLNWLHARLSQAALHVNATWDDTQNALCPGSQVDYAGSDSSVLDFCVESLLMDGDSVESAFMKLIPEAYEHHSHLTDDPEIEHFYEFFAPHQEPWDGPALVAFSDAIKLGAILDRNGLRPARYSIYEDGSIILASEAGVKVTTDAPVVKRGRLGPGQMIVVDIEAGTVQFDIEAKADVAKQHPYGQWLLKERRALKEIQFTKEWSYNTEELTSRQIAAGYTAEDVDNVITYMVLNDSEPVLSMGDDTPLAVLSTRPKKLSDYFRQRFAQVTNPPIDPIRERLVMSLTSYLGNRSANLRPDPMLAQTILLPGPIINDDELQFVESLSHEYKSARILTGFSREESLEETLDRMAEEVENAVRDGSLIVILSDKDISTERTSVPMLAAVGAVHHHLINCGLRLKCSLVIETSQCWTSHQVALLIAYGAQCVVPYLAFETIRHWYWSDATQKLVNGNFDHDGHGSGARGSGGSSATEQEKYRGLSVYQAQTNYKSVLESGLLKIISKMGVSKLTSYVGSQIFEALGLGEDIVEKCFSGTNSPIGGLTFYELEREVRELHDRGFSSNVHLVDEGLFKNKRTGEYHRNNNDLVKALHQAVLLREEKADDHTRSEQFQTYRYLVGRQQVSSLRDLLEVKSDRIPIHVSAVEPVDSIVKRFCTGGMSLGALSKESHEALAIAMNRLGARSNSGEGGEDPNRYHPIQVEADGTSPAFPGLTGLKQGDSAASKVRQVASARFGVTPEYLATAEQLEIKVAQGAKPGEGGQLPSHKVSEYIAKLRRTEPGITLISPPPHHDIYSIEDLAQLIYDLKQVNDSAEISVKLVSEQGIGPIALGCAKAGADIVHIAGHDGGTGAAPIGSIKHAGLPWELGLSESHRFLTEHQVRDSTTLRVDGGLRSGTDVVKAALMGGDEFAFGTIALIAQGCIMARVCHTNNCPTGIATQKDALRQKFHGSPDSVVEFFLFIAEEVRYLLAHLGYKSLAEIRGRSDLLQVRNDLKLAKCGSLNLTQILVSHATESGIAGATTDRSIAYSETTDATACRIMVLPDTAKDTVYAIASGADSLEVSHCPDEERTLMLVVDNSGRRQTNICGLNELLINDPTILQAIKNQSSVIKGYHIANVDRTVGAGLSGLIARLHGDNGFTGQIVLNFEGTAGQSFGAFNANNVFLYLTGEANDYVGKGMFGGEIVVRSPANSSEAEGAVLVGNTCLYGAVGGRMLVSGLAGERFAVRNSGAQAVVEGVGDHGCEYMTGGTVVVLGPTGRNFGAGMSGGIALVLDENGTFADRVNQDCDKGLYALTPQSETKLLALLEDHVRLTGSAKARMILDNWDHYRTRFVQLVPPADRERAGVSHLDQSSENIAASS